MKERQDAGTETNAEHFMNQEIRLPRLKTLTFHDKSLATLHFLPRTCNMGFISLVFSDSTKLLQE